MGTKRSEIENIPGDGGMASLEKLARKLGYGDDVGYMFEDNPGMVEAVLEAALDHGTDRDGVALED